MSQKLNVVLCWHMHQPEYREPVSGRFQLPWTYLHAVKDYVDMAAHLEAVPEARAVVNFVPTLLEQIEDYAEQVRRTLAEGVPLRDRLLGALAAPSMPEGIAERTALMRFCLRANEKRLIGRFAAYGRLVEIAKWHLASPEGPRYLNDGFLGDLVVWYHLAWLGETVRRGDLRVKSLLEKAGGYTLEDRTLLLRVIGELLGRIIGRYRALHERGQVELSVTPYAHPILPLLLEFPSAREALPKVSLPGSGHYPEGEARAHWHVLEGLASFRRFFGFTPQGCWPAEGSVSSRVVALLAGHGFRWVASGETVLRNSLQAAGLAVEAERHQGLHRPWRVAGGTTRCFFRSDGLSDLIGFSYADWHADDAVANLVHQLESIAVGSPNPGQRVVSIILDGENAWEFYPENGYYFLSALYRRLAAHPRIRMTTFAQCLEGGGSAAAAVHAGELPALVAGSWVYGTFSTWIGDADKNRAWDMLCEAGDAFQRAAAAGRLSGEALAGAERQLAVCEGSDWFWWFGDYNPAESVRDFDRLYRLHLQNLYHLIGEPPPSYLDHPFSHGGGEAEAGGTMRRGA